MKIPQTFHRIWLGQKPMPAEFQQFGRTWERLHPGWEMRLWTDANLPALTNQAAFDEAPSFAAKADILRYEILLQHGGVYVDTDFECLRSIEPLIEGIDCFVAQQRDLDADFGKFCYVNNALMGAVPGHPLFRDLVGLLGQHMRGLPPDVPASYLTGPHFLTTVLQAHPTVKIFPARQFYPYTATERWRRHEKFPEAYAVHHWTLSDVAVMRAKPRRLGDGGRPSLAVVLMPVREGDTLRLRWVLEGLCLQSVTDFEVLVVHRRNIEAVAALCGEFSGRLRIRRLSPPEDNQNGPTVAALRNLALAQAQASRVLFLDSDCLPDPDVVETHARYADKAMLLFGYRRIYPVEKMFSYRDAVDYGGIAQNSVPERRNLYVVPSGESWKDVASCCFSVPVAFAVTQGGFDEHLSEGEARALAEKLAAHNCPSVPCIYSARVTQMGPETRTSSAGGQEGAQPMMLRLNESIAKLHARGKAAGQGINGQSPYVLRVATLNGPRNQRVSALHYHLLGEFKIAQAPNEAITRVAKRVAVDPDKLERVAGLCTGYIQQSMGAGILVPAMAAGENPGPARSVPAETLGKVP